MDNKSLLTFTLVLVSATRKIVLNTLVAIRLKRLLAWILFHLEFYFYVNLYT